MRIIPFLVLAASIILPAALLAQRTSPGEIFHRADAAAAGATSASYDARFVLISIDGIQRVYAGHVCMERGGGMMKARVELDDGDILASDGAALFWISPGRKKMWRYDESYTFENIFQGNFQGRLLSEPFHRAEPFAALDSAHARFVGMVDFGGTPCLAVRSTPPDGPEVTGISELRYFGRDDQILRYSTASSQIRDIPYTDTIAISNLRLNIPLPDSLFTFPLPAGCTLDTVHRNSRPKPLGTGSAAPMWELTDMNGGRLSLAELRGRVVVLDFWYMACLPCQRTMPKLAGIRRMFDTANVTIIGLNPYDSLAAAAEFLQRKGFGYRFAFRAGEIAGRYNVLSYPTIYVIGRDGRIVASHNGDADDLEKQLAEEIRSALR